MPDLSDAAPPGRAAFAQHLRAVRQAAGMTQEHLDQAAGLDRSLYAEVETGKHSIAVDRLFDLATALHINPKDLLPDLPRARPEPPTGR